MASSTFSASLRADSLYWGTYSAEFMDNEEPAKLASRERGSYLLRKEGGTNKINHYLKIFHFYPKIYFLNVTG